jgi:hypothetical protein
MAALIASLALAWIANDGVKVNVNRVSLRGALSLGGEMGSAIEIEHSH